MSGSERVYRSPIPFESARIHAAAVYCSDGRIGDHMDDFLHQGLTLPRYDRVACPGGPVALAGRLPAFWESRGVADQLRFLVEVHDVHQVVLIAHGGCAYYGQRLGMDPATAEMEQREDLSRAASAVQRIDAALEVSAFFAHVDGTTLSYEPVFASEHIASQLRKLAPGGPSRTEPPREAKAAPPVRPAPTTRRS